jgi:hypothetical protein
VKVLYLSNYFLVNRMSERRRYSLRGTLRFAPILFMHFSGEILP